MSITWNGTNLLNYGIVVDNSPVIFKATKNVELYEIEGRNGFLAYDKGTYQPFVVSLECHINTTNFSIDSVKSALDGYGKVSFDGTREYEAVVSNAISFSRFMQFRSFTLMFQCNPIAHTITSSTANGLGGTVTTLGNYKAYPVLTIEGDGDISVGVGNSTFYLYGLDNTETYTLDSDLKVIVDSNGNNCATMMSGDFPALASGSNTITTSGTITTLTFTWQDAWL